MVLANYSETTILGFQYYLLGFRLRPNINWAVEFGKSASFASSASGSLRQERGIQGHLRGFLSQIRLQGNAESFAITRLESLESAAAESI